MAKIKMEEVSSVQLENKVRALRETYTKAVEWRNKTGQGVLETEGEQSVNCK
jgi:hypothetical protein